MNEKFNRLMPESEGSVLCYDISKPITLEGYQQNFLKPVMNIIERYGELRLLLYYSNYKGWEEQAAALDFSSQMDLGDKLKKLAIVNAPEKEIMARIIRKPLVGAELKFFSKDRLGEALQWVKTD